MFKLTKGGAIQRLSDNAVIPNDPLNRDFAEFQAWVDQGNTAAPYEVPVEEQNAPIQVVIDREEMKSLRAIREFLLGDTTALTRLQASDALIANRRSRLK